ncbi:MAG TPA: Hint domain-containing protein [Thermodesulfobacteriota bacterium]|nr:Hint domain-containing protein [Thermodesulfobacteriota bacterium]
MDEKKILDKVNPERREFLEKVTKGAFIIPTVISVMMLNQKLNLTTANAQSNLAPNCLSCDALISTPEGNVPVSYLRTGMVVFTLDKAGNKVIEPVELLMKLSGAEGYEMRLLVLSDGRELIVSGTHPTAEYGRISDLCIGDTLDGAKILSIEKVSHSGSYIYDLLPAGDTGFYWANGVLLGSTLSPNSGFNISKIFQPNEQPIHG